MRLLHTSDWHLGQNFYGYDRTAEHRQFLLQLRDIVCQARPDAMVVSGDIFHNYTPSAQTLRLYTDSLVAIHEARPEMRIIVTAGNHDSASRLDADGELWRLANVSVIGRLPRDAEGHVDFASTLISVGDKGLVMALPYIFEQAYPAAPDGADPRKSFFAMAGDYVTAHNPQGLPTALMAHLTVLGSDTSGQRVKAVADGVGGIDCMPVSDFPAAFDYVALGHIHRPQTVAERAADGASSSGGAGRVRYSGSPLPVSFDEDYRHSVSIVDVDHGRQPSITVVPIGNPCPLLTIPREPLPTADALEALRRDVPTEGPCYVRFNPLERRAFPVTMQEDVIATLAEVNPNAMYTTYLPNFAPSEAEEAAAADVTPEQLAEMEPVDVARQYCQMLQEDFADYEDLFRQVMDKISREDAQ